MNTKIQFRGNCQCCGRQQAVLSTGHISKHGYTVESGWFSGICRGMNYQPMQLSRVITDDIVAKVRADVAKLLIEAQQLKDGKLFPKTAQGNWNLVRNPKTGLSKREYDVIPFDTAPDYKKQDAINAAIYHAAYRARLGTSYAHDLEALVNKVHRTALIEIKKDVGPAPILSGEKRTSNGVVLTCIYVDGARVYWTYERHDGKIVKSWSGSSAWRKYELFLDI